MLLIYLIGFVVTVLFNIWIIIGHDKIDLKVSDVPTMALLAIVWPFGLPLLIYFTLKYSSWSDKILVKGRK